MGTSSVKLHVHLRKNEPVQTAPWKEDAAQKNYNIIKLIANRNPKQNQ
jgi:hypothetical protein